MGTQSTFSVHNDGRTSASDFFLRDFKLGLDVGSLDNFSKRAAHLIIADATDAADAIDATRSTRPDTTRLGTALQDPT